MNPAADKSALPATANVFDVGGLAALKRQAKAGDPAANKAVARQFEALFLQMVLKSMREAMPRDGLFDSQQSRLYESLLDQQMAQVVGGSGRGTGLAALIEAQLMRQQEVPVAFEGGLPLRRDPSPLPLPQSILPRTVAPVTTGAVPAAPTVDAAVQRSFVERLLPAATEAEARTGIPAHFLVAQAALETGWGRSEPRRADGAPSFNLFGIKAGAGWRGATVEASTTEFAGGVAQTRVERFRAYASYEESFRDYATLLAGTPRYAAVLGAQEPARFARGLQAAGYATDPAYAAKLERIIGGTALRQALAG